MIYTEFESKVKEQGYSCNNHQTGFDVYIKDTNKILVSIHKNVQYSLSTYYYNIVGLSPEERKWLLTLSDRKSVV